MRILQINKFFYPRGGAERYFLDLVELLPRHGHETAPFSMSHPRNLPSPFARHFVSHVDYTVEAGPIGAALTAVRTLYNRESRRRLRALVGSFRPDVAHLHNVHHQLSGSVIETLADEKIPMVQSLHDYQWVCPVYTFVRRGRVCEECRGRKFHRAIRHRCHGGSLLKSTVAALDLMLGYRKGWPDRIARFLAPSAFLAAKVVEHGLPADRVRREGYLLSLDRYRPGGERGEHALYAGRLSREKGVETLLRALAHVDGLEVRVAGTGPMEPELRRIAEAVAPDRVRFLGHLDGDALHAELAAAGFAVVPSEWYENQPFAILEAFALETPVVGASIGGIPELVRHGATGLLFESGSVESLADALRAMREHPDRRALGRAAREFVESAFDPSARIASLLEVYREVAA